MAGRIRVLASRRAALRAMGAGFALSAVSGGLWLPRDARASDLSLTDRIDLLYSNQFHFNVRGEPQVTIGVMEGQTSVKLIAKDGLRVLPSGDGGTAIVGGAEWRIELASGRPAVQRYCIALDELPQSATKAIGRRLAHWRKLGLKPTDREVGTLFGVQGRLLDTRRVLLTTGDYGSEADAARKARILRQRHGALGKLHAIVEKRSSGTIVAHDLTHDIRIEAEGVLWFAPVDKGSMTVKSVLHGTTIGKASREDREYRGQIYVAVDRHGKLAVVNLVSETDVLAGLVPAEIFASAPTEALRAQAVAARGQLVTKIGTRHLDDPFLLCSEQHCQVYAGRAREHARTNRAVEATAGVVLMRPNGSHLVDTVYCANSGGHTEDNEVVWPSPRDPQLRGRADPRVDKRFAGGITDANLEAWLSSTPDTYSRPTSDRLLSSYRWKATVDPSAVAGRPGVPKKLGKIEGLRVLERGRSGRATRLRVTGERGEVDVVGELRIRRALGDLRSSMFLVLGKRDAYGRFQLVGGGHGHGVGLCQHGAIGMARDGRSFRKILAHYYKGSKATKLW